MKSNARGYLLVLSAYFAWGVLPIYWRLLADIPPVQVLFNRVFWSMVLLSVVLSLRGELTRSLRLLKEWKNLRVIMLTSTLLVINWGTYLWAIAKGELVAASLGYFICPLLTMAAAAFVLNERVTRGEAVSIVTLLLGVSLPVAVYGNFPWIALVLGGSWSMYTLVRRQIKIDSLVGVFLETLMIAPLVGLVTAKLYGTEALLPHAQFAGGAFLLVASGVVTALPQIALVKGARLVPLKFVGISQYLAPTIALMVSIFMYNKIPTQAELLSLVIIWIGIFIFFVGDRVGSYLFGIQRVPVR